MGGSRGGGSRGSPPLFCPRCGLFNIRPKAGPPPGAPFFACKPKMGPPFQESWIRHWDYTRLCAQGAKSSNPVPLQSHNMLVRLICRKQEKSIITYLYKTSCPDGRCTSNFIHQVIIITRLNKLGLYNYYDCMFSP